MNIKTASIEELFAELDLRKQLIFEQCRKAAEIGLEDFRIAMVIRQGRMLQKDFAYIAAKTATKECSIITIHLPDTIIPVSLILADRVFHCTLDKIDKKIINWLKKPEIKKVILAQLELSK